jgi:hypothetical protein
MSDLRPPTTPRRRTRATERFLAPATPAEGATLLEALEDEKSFQRWLTDLATLNGWRCWHDNFSLRNDAGFLDLFLVRGNRLIIAELKTMRGQVRPEQREWLAALHTVADASGGAVSVYLWRPSNRAEIEEVLR